MVKSGKKTNKNDTNYSNTPSYQLMNPTQYFNKKINKHKKIVKTQEEEDPLGIPLYKNCDQRIT